MILPIIAYGDPILRKKTNAISGQSKELDTLIKNMWETMYNANGVGLSAPQIGKSIRIFIVDSSPFAKSDRANPNESEKLEKFKKVFINPTLIEEKGAIVKYEEGCLSIPAIFHKIDRKEQIKLHYFDEDFNEHEELFDGLIARIIQHEYDHLEGKLFIDKLSPFKKDLIKNKLSVIQKGKIESDYKMAFFKK